MRWLLRLLLLVAWPTIALAADTKTSALSDGTPLRVDDELAIARSSDNNKIDGEDLVAVLHRTGTAVDVTNTTTETTICTFTVPGNTLSTNRGIEVIAGGDYLNNNATSATLRLEISYGGTNFYVDSVDVASINAARRPWYLRFILAPNNSTASENMFGFFLLGNAGGATTGVGDLDTDEIESVTPFGNVNIAVDSTADQTLAMTFQWDVTQSTTSARLFSCTGLRL